MHFIIKKIKAIHKITAQTNNATLVSNTMHTRTERYFTGNKRLLYRSQKAVPTGSNKSIEMVALETARFFWTSMVRGGHRKQTIMANSRAWRYGLFVD